jgi:hypothetical protein
MRQDRRIRRVRVERLLSRRVQPSQHHLWLVRYHIHLGLKADIRW